MPSATQAWVIFGICLTIKNLSMPTRRTLWPCYSAASRNWWSGLSLYDRIAIPFDYRYSPSFAVAYTPFTWGPDWLGAAAWGLFLLMVLWLGLRALQRDVLPLNWTPLQIEIWLCLTLLGMSHSLWSGQSNTLIVACATGACSAIARGRWWMAGLLLVAPGFIKVWPFLLALLCFLSWPRKLCLPCVVWSIAGAALPFLTQKPRYVYDEYIEWWRCLRSGPIMTRIASYDAWGLWDSFRAPISETGYLSVQILSVIGLIVLTLRMAYKHTDLKLRLTSLLLAWSSWQLFLGPGVEKNTLSLLTPGSSWAWLRGWELKQGRGLLSLALVLTLTAIQFNDTWAVRIGGEWVRLLHPVGLILLWGGILQAGMLRKDEDSMQDSG
ncbi:MAG: glycosyltransferase family 87 protein [Planctomycetales bacterium]